MLCVTHSCLCVDCALIDWPLVVYMYTTRGQSSHSCMAGTLLKFAVIFLISVCSAMTYIDIGTKTVENYSVDEKVDMCKDYTSFHPEPEYLFPLKLQGKRNRRFQKAFLKGEYACIAYSKARGSIYCTCCLFFGLKNTGSSNLHDYSDWSNQTIRIRTHFATTEHKTEQWDAAGFVERRVKG